MLLHLLVIPNSEITLYGTSPFAKIYFYLCSLLLNGIFFYVNSITIQKHLNNPYYNLMYFLSVLILFLIVFFNYHASDTFDVKSFALLLLGALIISSFLFYATYLLVRVIVTKWKEKYFVLLLPVVFVDLEQYSTYWILVSSTFLYFMFQLASSPGKEKEIV